MLRLIVWNGGGDGTNAVPVPVVVGADGVATFSVPLHAAFALTTAFGA